MSDESEIKGDSDRPWGELFALTIDRLTATVEGMHDAIVQPWLSLAGPAARQLRGAYAVTTSSVYRSVRGVASVAGRVSDSARSTSAGETTLRSDAVQAFSNAIWGDELKRQGSAMAIDAAVRDGRGAVVQLETAALARAFPAASGRLVVLLHGLGQTERCFSIPETHPGLADTLALSPFTPVLVRYNSGRSIRDSGAELAALLDGLTEQWPVRVTEIALVGYSMGGLVARAAIEAGRATADSWVDVARHVVTIASPHAGSPIEKAVEAATRSLMVVPQTRPLAEFLESRSAGIRDLRSGTDLPTGFDGVEHHLIGAVITSNATHPVGAFVGDLVVRPISAIGPRLIADNVALVGGRRHFDILAEPTLADRILSWIDEGHADRPSSAVTSSSEV